MKSLFLRKEQKETTGLNWLLKDSNAVIKKYSAQKSNDCVYKQNNRVIIT